MRVQPDVSGKTANLYTGVAQYIHTLSDVRIRAISFE